MVDPTDSENEIFYPNTFDDIVMTNDRNIAVFDAPLDGILDEIPPNGNTNPTAISNEQDFNTSANYDPEAVENNLSGANYDYDTNTSTSTTFDSEAIENDLSAANYDNDTIENNLAYRSNEEVEAKNATDSNNDCNIDKKDPTKANLLDVLNNIVHNDKEKTNVDILNSFIDEGKTTSNDVEMVGATFVDQQILEEVDHADDSISSEKVKLQGSINASFYCVLKLLYRAGGGCLLLVLVTS